MMMPGRHRGRIVYDADSVHTRALIVLRDARTQLVTLTSV